MRNAHTHLYALYIYFLHLVNLECIRASACICAVFVRSHWSGYTKCDAVLRAAGLTLRALSIDAIEQICN